MLGIAGDETLKQRNERISVVTGWVDFGRPVRYTYPMPKLRRLLNSIVWTTQDASEARKATTLPGGALGCFLDPLAGPIHPNSADLYALHLTGIQVTKIHLDKALDYITLS